MRIQRKVSIILPSLNPDEKLKNTVRGLVDKGFDDIIIVDDGSDNKHNEFFPTKEEFPEVTLLVHHSNKGKGAALKTAFRYFKENRPKRLGVITVDGDGQHRPEDVLKCTKAMEETKTVILGARDFAKENVPFKSRAGNTITRFVLGILCGIKVKDTQTGLRAIPSKYIDFLCEIEGERFDYETNMLLEFKKNDIEMTDVDIQTVYIDDNATSHFHAVKDSFLVYRFILKFIFSSTVGAIVDLGLFWILNAVFKSQHVITFTIIARIVSSLTNFTLNKKMVFKNNDNVKNTILRYYALAIPQMLISGGSVKLISILLGAIDSSILTTLIKIGVDVILFFISYRIQRNWVFKEKNENDEMNKNISSEETPQKLSTGTVVKRIFLCVGTALAYVIVAIFGSCFVLANGPSTTVRDAVVLSAMQASATKWVPGLFLSDKTVTEIVENSHKVNTDVVDIDDYEGDTVQAEDEWDNAVDGMLYYTVSNNTYKAYVIIIKDPSRVFVGTSSENFSTATEGMRFAAMAKKYDALAMINGGEFSDLGGTGNGATPIGLTYSLGKCVWGSDSSTTFIGIDNNNNLVVSEGMKKANAEKLGIRDAVSFQSGNVLITSDEDNVKLHYNNKNTGRAQRTGIGQRKDGSIIMIVTDGRSASSLGATHNDMIDLMVNYGAVTAALLDGGSSSMLYYEDYYEKYDYDVSALDEYQRQGLVNNYKAFTNPRRLPTYFIVSKES